MSIILTLGDHPNGYLIKSQPATATRPVNNDANTAPVTNE
ncbi:hypothetical protein DEU53_10311 [Pantoea sp. AG1095]|nr:hypothetical protein DEU53_10311 [Pantoea sp. AG1095]